MLISANNLIFASRRDMKCPTHVLLLSVLSSLVVRTLGQAQNVIKLPVQVDQQGKSIYFVTDADSDVAAEAVEFCRVHLPTVDTADCAANLEQQVKLLRHERAKAQSQLPGLTFTVNNEQGEELRFTHEEGADPAYEAKLFCLEHFGGVPEKDCVEHMLQNAKRALDEIQAKQEL